MNPLYILRLIRGYVTFQIKGGFSERFINYCAAQGINLWDMSINGDTVTACVPIKSFRRLRKAVKESGGRLKIIKKSGILPYINKHKNRSGIIISAIFCILFFTVMNKFIWIIDVEGTSKISHQEIIEYLYDNGLKQGTSASSVDTVALSRKAVNHFNGRLLWMAININKSKATVEVRDYTDILEDKQFREPCNIIADFNGILLYVKALNGNAEVTAGSAVKKGDLLISGVADNDDMSVSYYEARGTVTALHDTRYTEEYSFNNGKIQSVNNINNTYSVNIFGIDIPLGLKNKGDIIFTNKKALCYNGYKLPLSISKESEGKTAATEILQNAALLLSLDNYTASFYEKYKNTNILSCESRLQQLDGKYVITSDLYCIDYIGVKSPIIREFYEN